MTPKQKKAVGFALLVAGLITTFAGWTIPGGATGNVEVGLEDIALRTWPWTASVAAIAWMLVRQPFDSVAALGGASVAVLALGAVLGFACAPDDYFLTSAQVDNPMYAPLVEVQPQVAVRAAQVAAHNPEATLIAAGLSVGFLVVFAYWMLYGPALWIAGLIAGGIFAWQLHEIFSEQR